MNEIKIKTNFTKRTCIVKGVNLTSGDYNSTKLVFDFDRQDGTKIFEMNNPSGDLLFMDEIKNNEVILVAKQDITTKHNDITYIEYKDNQNNTYYYDSESDKLYDSTWTEVAVFNLEDYTKQQKNVSLFSEAGKYTFEVSLYEEDSKLTSASGTLTIKQSQVDIDDESVEQYLPVFDTLINNIKDALNEVEEEITKTNNLNIDLSDKVGKNATITLTKKDGTTKTVTLSDGTSLMFNWDGTKLGIKTDEQASYTYVDLKGATGNTGETGNGISSITLNNDYTLTVNYTNGTSYTTTSIRGAIGNGIANITLNNDYTLTITYTDGNSETTSSIRGATGATGATPDIQIGTVTSGAEASVTITGTDEEPILNFVLPKGDTGETGATGATGNGISSITKTGTSGLTDTYTITYTNGTTSTFTVKNGKEISSITKTSTSGLVDTYTITFTDSTTATLTVTNGRSITNIEKTSVDGLVDTYTITYNDGTTSTFNVTNGEDGEVTQTQLDETNKRVDLNSKLRNALPKVTGTGTEITLNDTAEAEMVLSLSGNTEQSTTTGSNLLETKNISRTISGVTFTVNEDGSITINGTATADTQFFINTGNNVNARTVPLKGNTSYIFKGKNDDNILVQAWYGKNNVSAYALNKFVTEEETNLGAYIKIQSGKTINNYTVYPQLVEGTELPEWEPYTGGIASPNPDYPQDIVNATGNNSVKIEGKNLGYTNWATDFVSRINDSNKAKIENVDGRNTLYYSANAGYQEYNAKYLFKINWKENTQYTFNFDLFSPGIDTNVSIAYTDGTSTYFGTKTANVWEHLTITSQANKTIKYLRSSYNDRYSRIDLNTFMVEEGTTASPYIPYTSQIYPITLGNIEMASSNDNRDCFEYDKVNDKWYFVEYMANKIFDGTETWGYSGSNVAFYTDILTDIKLDGNFLTSHFKKISTTTSFANMKHGETKFASATSTRIFFKNTDYTSATNFKEWLSTNNVEIEYELATPISTQITDTTLISQLEAIRLAYAYQDQTNIIQTNDGAPFNIDAEAVADVSKIISNLTNAIIEIGGGE